MKKPDWNVWGAKEQVAVWQAPLLSLDRDPDRINFESINWFGLLNHPSDSPPNDNLPPEIDDAFKKRLGLLWKALHSSTKYFSDDGEWGNTELEDDVRLHEFAAWCELSKLDVPDPLAEIGKAYGGAARLHARYERTHARQHP